MLSPDPWSWLMAGATAFGWAGLSWHCLRPPRAGPRHEADLLILWASQSGTAAGLAGALAEQLSALSPRLLPLDQLSATDLQRARRAVFVIATTGAGEAPDHASGALERLQKAVPDLTQLSYALLALGDRRYADFCGFGRRLEVFLRNHGARDLLPRAEIDRACPAALARISRDLGKVFGAAPLPPQQPSRWRLIARRHINPGSPGGALYALRFQPEAMMPDWQAGDIARLTLPGEAGPVARDYSLASLPEAGWAELILRQVRDAQGRTGQGSGYLTRQLAIGDTVPLQLRANPGFRARDHAAPMILIGNGSGMAGLLSHLRARAAALPAAGTCRLFFGERSPVHDRIFADELASLQACGLSLQIERAFSRAETPRYVQDLLHNHAASLREDVKAGGHIFLCGRREGMAGAVLACLRAGLGEDLWQKLRTENRLHQDVY